MKTRLSVFTVIVLFFALILSQCRQGKAKRLRHDFAASEAFKKLSREEQVKKCGSCHQEEYENEMLGPHAHAYTNLKAHLDFVNSKNYDCKAYKDFVNNFNETCFSCHTARNIYETVFTEKKGDFNFNLTLFGKKKKTERRDATEMTTGVDCITCHFDGEAVVAGADFKPSANSANCPGYCNPVASGFFSSNGNCQPCHTEQFYNVRLFNNTNHVDLTCASCHEEKDATGKYTHYTYWAHNPSGKPEPENLNLFNTIEASYIPEKNEVKIVWPNKYLPHMVSICTELVAFIEIKDGPKTIKGDTIRLNRRTKYIAETSRVIDIKNLPGITGYEFKGLNDSLVKLISLPPADGQPHYTLSLTGIKKEQYWLNDSINTVYYRKTFQL